MWSGSAASRHRQRHRQHFRGHPGESAAARRRGGPALGFTRLTRCARARLERSRRDVFSERSEGFARGKPAISWRKSREDPKLSVRILFSHYLQRSMSSEDISFITETVHGGYQCTVQQHCWGGSTFVGALRAPHQKAEQDAFKLILHTYKGWIEWLA